MSSAGCRAGTETTGRDKGRGREGRGREGEGGDRDSERDEVGDEIGGGGGGKKTIVYKVFFKISPGKTLLFLELYIGYHAILSYGKGS